MKHPSNSEINALLSTSTKPPIDDVPGNMDAPLNKDDKKILSVEVSEPTLILDEPPQIDEAATRKVPITNQVLDDPHHDDNDDANYNIEFIETRFYLSNLLSSRTQFQFL